MSKHVWVANGCRCHIACMNCDVTGAKVSKPKGPCTGSKVPNEFYVLLRPDGSRERRVAAHITSIRQHEPRCIGIAGSYDRALEMTADLGKREWQIAHASSLRDEQRDLYRRQERERAAREG